MARRYTERIHTKPWFTATVAALVVLPTFAVQSSFANVAKKAAGKPCTLAAAATLTVQAHGDSNLPYLPGIVRETLRRHFGLAHANSTLTEFVASFKVPQQFQKRAGLFVTLSKDGKTRACWGSLDGSFDNLVKATIYTTEQALTNEYRYRKITASEIELLKPQVTVVEKTESLHSLNEQNPRTCGMIVRSGGKSGVILPGECTDSYYQMVQCKLKAGITRNEPCQIYRIRANVYR